jgi:hypothetical protein
MSGYYSNQDLASSLNLEDPVVLVGLVGLGGLVVLLGQGVPRSCRTAWTWTLPNYVPENCPDCQGRTGEISWSQ